MANSITVVIEVRRGVRLEVEAEGQVGFNRQGEVVIKEKAQQTLHKYKLQILERDLYQEIWSEDIPPGVNSASIRAVTDLAHEVLLQDNSSATMKWRFHNLKHWNSWNDEGIILPCSGIGRVYAVEKTAGEYEIIIHDNHFKARIQPVAGRSTWKDPYLSVCVSGVPEDRIAVTSTNHTLDIYSREYGK